MTGTSEAREWQRGYDEQTAWLARERPTLNGARNCLMSRRGTLADDPYNRGGNRATVDYIAQLCQGTGAELPPDLTGCGIHSTVGNPFCQMCRAAGARMIGDGWADLPTTGGYGAGRD